MTHVMNLKKQISIAIVIIILIATMVYGEDSTDKIFNDWEKGDKEIYNEQQKALDHYLHMNILASILGGVGIFVFVICLSQALKQEKKKGIEAVRDVIRNELNTRIAYSQNIDNCANCGTVIGKLEKRYAFEGHLELLTKPHF